MRFYIIDGFWTDDRSNFYDYVVTDTHDVLDDRNSSGLTDDDIFFYGLSREALTRAVETRQPVANQFVITSFRKL